VVAEKGYRVENDAGVDLEGSPDDADDDGVEGAAGPEEVAPLDGPRDDVQGDVGLDIAGVVLARPRLQTRLVELVGLVGVVGLGDVVGRAAVPCR